MTSRSSVRWWVGAGLAISLTTVIVMLAVYQAQGQLRLRDAIAGLDWWVLPAAIGLHVAAHFAWGARESCLARGVGWRLPLLPSFRIITAGVFGAAVTPARVGGDGIRIAMMRPRADDPGQPAQIILAGRTLDLLFFIGMGMLATTLVPVLFGEDALWVRSLAVAGIGFFLAILALIVALVSSRGLVRLLLKPGAVLLRRVAKRRGGVWVVKGDRLLDDVRDGIISLLRERPTWLAAAWALTIAEWMLEFSLIYVLLQGFGIDVAYLPVVLAAVLLNIIMTLPITPGGSGLAEIGALGLYAALDSSVTPVFVLVWRATTYYYDLGVGGLVTVRSAAGWLAGRDEGEGGSGEG